MASDQHSVVVLPASRGASDAKASTREVVARETRAWPWLLDAARLRSPIGLAACAILASGAIFACVCTMWAIREGVAAPLAIMAGYCTLIGGACLFTAVLVAQNLSIRVGETKAGEPRSQPAAASRQPNYTAWKLVSRLSVSDASRLWCDIEPGCPSSQESIAWGFAMLDAIRQGKLPIVERVNVGQAPVREQSNPTWHTEVTRDALKTWAQAHGHAPRFLQG